MSGDNHLLSDEDLHAYVDGRLPEERRAEVERYLAGNPEILAKVTAYQEQNRLLHACFDPVLEESVPAGWQLPARRKRNPLQATAAAIAFVALGAVFGWFLRGLAVNAPAQEGEFARQAALAHAVYTPEVRHPVEVTADQEQHLVNWLSKRLGRRLKVPSLVDLGFELVGGRLLPGDRGPVAQFMYQESSGRRLTLYIRTDPSDERETAFRYSQYGKVAVFYWLDDRLTYAISAEMPKDQLLKLANTVYERLNS